MMNQLPSHDVLTIAQALQVDLHLFRQDILNNTDSLHETNDLIDVQDLKQLLIFVLNKNYAFIRTYPDFQLTVDQTNQYLSFKQQLQSGIPLAYVLGTQAFWTMEFKVTPDTLIPRPDTEIVIISILEVLPKNKALNVIDMGTGTGAIALSLARECPLWKVTATDFSSNALTVAKENAQKYDLNQVRFLQGSWFEALPDVEKFDLIVSNPPYIDPEDLHLVDLTHEPRSALVAHDKGLSDLKKIIAQAPCYLKLNGLLILEHGYDQGQAVRTLMSNSGLTGVRTVRDYGENERVTLGFKTAEFGVE
jgi:release factor glutamine methyltransferase